ncbi:hypothetical protein NDU88_005553 [Pleurodeles waltl]|uniref:Uncharacterized protein n=1 Tax=Pleurodeles waltl TaxID=8319 RepID=A0AAV7PJ77_PLEWA|nr:hypothetical protein NDU88_005553 [Pleurodeles waltl]
MSRKESPPQGTLRRGGMPRCRPRGQPTAALPSGVPPISPLGGAGLSGPAQLVRCPHCGNAHAGSHAQSHGAARRGTPMKGGDP